MLIMIEEKKGHKLDIKHWFVKPVLKISFAIPNFNTSHMHEVANAIVDTGPILFAFIPSKLGHKTHFGDPIYDEYDNDSHLKIQKIVINKDKGKV